MHAIFNSFLPLKIPAKLLETPTTSIVVVVKSK